MNYFNKLLFLFIFFHFMFQFVFPNSIFYINSLSTLWSLENVYFYFNIRLIKKTEKKMKPKFIHNFHAFELFIMVKKEQKSRVLAKAFSLQPLMKFTFHSVFFMSFQFNKFSFQGNFHFHFVYWLLSKIFLKVQKII